MEQNHLVQAVRDAQSDLLLLILLVTLLFLLMRLLGSLLRRLSSEPDRQLLYWQERRERKARRELMDRFGQTDKTELGGRMDPPIL